MSHRKKKELFCGFATEIFWFRQRVNPIREVLRLSQTVIPLNLIPIGHPAEKKKPRTQYGEKRVHHQHW
jgi:hypothetical protein